MLRQLALHTLARTRLVPLAAGLVFACATPASAHPHVYIDMISAPVFNQVGQMTALSVDWTFDEFYSLFATAALSPPPADASEPTAPNPPKDILLELAKANLDNLKSVDYFTFVSVNGDQPNYGPIETYDSEMRGGRLAMSFILPLAAPVDPRTAHVSYAVYDPTFYIEVLHWSGVEPSADPSLAQSCTAIAASWGDQSPSGLTQVEDNPDLATYFYVTYFKVPPTVTLGEGAPEGCYADILEPNPTEELLNFAAAIDRMETGPNGLGRHFAETVTLRCQSES
ncbi:MAG: DUF1007 family protein [Pseudomonadota bacterium]